MNDQKYQKSSKDFPSLENLPASSRFAFCKQPSPSGANRASEPSRYSIVTATGSKRSSADSDSLLCHVRLWQTSRLKFGCVSGCEHSEIGFILIVPSAHILDSRCPVSATPTHMLRICVNPRHTYYAGVQTMRARICSAFSCAMFARVVWLRLRREAKLLVFALPFTARTRHALLPATNSCTPRELTNARSALVGVAETGQGSEGGRRESSLLTFGTFLHRKVR